MVWSDYLPIPLVIPPGAGDTDDRIVIDSTGITIYNGATPVILLVPNPSPDIRVVNSFGHALSLHVATGSGQPSLEYTLAGHTGYGLVDFYEHTAGKNTLELQMVGEGAGFVTVSLRENVIDGDGEMLINAPIVAEDPTTFSLTESWHDLILGNSWAHDANNHGQYRRMPDGMTQFRGHILSGVTVPGTVIATLPVGYRPQANKDPYFTTAMPNNNTVQGTVDVVGNTGQLRCINSPGVASLSLDQVFYWDDR